MRSHLVIINAQFTCHACGVKGYSTSGMPADEARLVKLPAGWARHEARVYCGRHEVQKVIPIDSSRKAA